MSDKFYIAKLNINGNIFSNDFEKIKFKYIPERIKEFKNSKCNDRFYEKEVNGKKVKYTLANIESLDNNNIFSGDIVKIYNRNVEKVVDAKTEIQSVEDGNNIHFFYLVNEELLFLEKNQYFSNTIADTFGNLINNSNKIGDLDIQLLTDTTNIKHAMLTETVTKLKFKYVMPNGRKTLAEMAPTIHNMRATKAHEEYINPKGLILTNKQENNTLSKKPNQMIDLINHGYGELIITIKNDNGEEQLIESNSNKNRKTINLQWQKNIKSVINKIKNAALTIFDKK